MPTVTIPEATYRRLAAKAAAQHTTVDDLATRLLAEDGEGVSKLDRLLDHDYHAECETDTAPAPTLEEVRAALAKLPGSLTADIIAERDER